jgi:hypothetical protein
LGYRASGFVHLQRIGKNQRLRKAVISSNPALRAKLHVSAIKRKSDRAKIFCVPMRYLKKAQNEDVNGEYRVFGLFKTCNISYVYGNNLIL